MGIFIFINVHALEHVSDMWVCRALARSLVQCTSNNYILARLADGNTHLFL